MISFLIVAFVVFMLVRGLNKMKKQEVEPEPDTKDCPFCFTAIPVKASRCPNCTSVLEQAV